MENQKSAYEVIELEQGSISLFERVLDRVTQGENIALTRDGKTVAMLVPAAPPTEPPVTSE